MRIAYLALIELDVSNACLIHTREIAEQWADQGHDVTLVLPEPLEPHCWKGVKHVWIKWWGFDRLRQWCFFFESYLKIWFQHRLSPFDVLYVREMERPPLLIHFCKWLNLPLFVEVNGWAIDDMVCLGATESDLQKIRVAQQTLFDKAAGIVVSTQGNVDNIVREYSISSGKVVAQELGVNAGLFGNIEKSMARQELDLPLDHQLVLFTGSFHPHHDLKTLIRAFSLALAKLPNMQLLLVGDGVERLNAERWVEEEGIEGGVVFAGVWPYEKMPYWLAASDLSVIPLLKRRIKLQNGSFVTKLWEAMAAERPVIITDLPETATSALLKELIFVIPPEDAVAMSDAIVNALLDKAGENDECIRRSKSYVLQNRTWSKEASSSIVFMEKMMAKPASKDGH